MSLGRMKGAPVAEFLVWYEERFGAERLREVAAIADPAKLKDIDVNEPGLGIVARDWYPAETIHALCDAFDLATNDGSVHPILREGTEASMEATLGGPVRRLMMRLIISPNTYMRNAPTLWHQYFDSGQVEVRQTSRTALEWHIDGWRSHHRMLCQMVTLSEASVFGAMGCFGVLATETACVTLGGARCAHTIEWQRR